MAATAATVAPPPHAAEDSSCSIVSYEDLTPPASQPSDASPDSPKLQTVPPPSPSPPLFLNSIAELKELSAAMSAFLHRYEDLHNHLESIDVAISAKLPPGKPVISQPSPQKPELVKEASIVNSQEDNSINDDNNNINPSKSELEGLCKAMCSRGVRKYLASHLSNLAMLREEVPKALRQAAIPSKLVLECLGKFFLQGSRAFTKDSPMIPAREASILVLECFLLMMGLELDANCEKKDSGMRDIEKAVHEEANAAALAWRKRLMTEGGVAKANQIDARGLLLFVACFGIPASFKAEDMRGLVIAGNAKEISGVLQKSQVLMTKISEIVDEMMKNKMEVEAVDMVYTFGLEERYNPQTILVSFLRESKETWKKPKKGSQASPAIINEANKRQLATLKSISRCLERHGIDPAKLLPGWQINQKLVTLQKDITDFEKRSGDRTSQKRKSNETEASTRPKVQEAKRLRHVDSRRSYYDNGHSNHVNTYSAPAVIYGGPGAGLQPESMIPSGAGASNHGGIRPSYAAYEGVLVDAARQAAARQVINRGSHPYIWHREAAINERYNNSQPPPLGLTNLYRASTSSVEAFPGNNGSSSDVFGNRGSASDLYHFADSVSESELYPQSFNAGSSEVPAHVATYLYQA